MWNKIIYSHLIYIVTKIYMLLIKDKSVLEIPLFPPSHLSINIIKRLSCATHPEDIKVSKISLSVV